MVSAVLFLSFGVSCLLDGLGKPFFVCHHHLSFALSLPQAFVVSFFSFFLFGTGICVRSLSFMAFSAVDIRVHFCLCLVSACFRVSVYLSILGIMPCTCCSSAASSGLEIRTGFFFFFFFFASGLPCGQPYKFRFEANPIWYSTIKFTKSHSAKCSPHKWA